MQTTELDETLSQTLEDAEKNGLKLVIGNKNYSSWSMRPWVAMTAFNIPFQEIRILLDHADTSAQITHYSASGRVPVLISGETEIWDSLAICEYLAEQFPEKKCGRKMLSLVPWRALSVPKCTRDFPAYVLPCA